MVEIKTYIDDMNIEVQLFKSDGHQGKPYGVRVRDLDAQENISSTFCPTIELAEKHYKATINNEPQPYQNKAEIIASVNEDLKMFIVGKLQAHPKLQCELGFIWERLDKLK